MIWSYNLSIILFLHKGVAILIKIHILNMHVTRYKIMKVSVISLFYGKAHIKTIFLVMDIANVRGGIRVWELAQCSALHSGLFGGTVGIHLKPHNQKEGWRQFSF